MAKKRDPDKTARNKEIQRLTADLEARRAEVMVTTGIDNLHVLHGKIGSKFDKFMDIKHDVIRSAEEFQSRYLEGFVKYLNRMSPDRRKLSEYGTLFKLLQEHAAFFEYAMVFMERAYLRNYEALHKVRPTPQDAELWIGENDANYGLLVTPRFNGAGEWENDKSEIRHFKPGYFTIGHVLETGLVVPDEDVTHTFDDVSDYLKFFRTILVRGTASPHQKALAKRYSDFVEESDDPLKVPLLIPELRYKGRERRHLHRLDFCIIDPYSLRKVGFELSPASTHMKVEGAKGKTQARINEEIKEQFEKEAAKLRNYFINWGISVLVFTDSQLAEPDGIFDVVKAYLEPEREGTQLLLHSAKQFLRYDLDAEVEADEDDTDAYEDAEG
jgi:hypothetical protein